MAAHEAGHAAVGVLLGGQVDVAETFDERWWATVGGGRCRFAPLDGPPVSWSLIAAAGPVAEAVARFGSRPTLAQFDAVLASGGRSDVAAMREGGADAVDSCREVLPLVLRVWPVVARLAVAMDGGRLVNHEAVVTALGLSRDRGLHGFECQNIRAGLRPVPAPVAV